MTKKLTGPELIQFFTDYSMEKGKLFVPDSPRQDAVADSLANHYEPELLKRAIQWIVDTEPGPFFIFDFAIKSRDYVEKAKYEMEPVNRFKSIVAETKRRMENS